MRNSDLGCPSSIPLPAWPLLWFLWIGCNKVRFSLKCWDWWKHLRAPACQSSKTKKSVMFSFFFSSPPKENRNKLQWFLSSWCQSLVCGSLRSVRVLCAHTLLTLGQRRLSLSAAPAISNTKGVIFCFWEAWVCRGVGLRNVGGGLQWGVCFFWGTQSGWGGW